ncbi:MAG TPA: hypothetical protein VH639_02885 [Bryobacteraceae bacterium]|jgi:hypothetical protein
MTLDRGAAPVLLWLACVMTFAGVATAQDPIPIDGPEPTAIHGARRAPTRSGGPPGPGLPIWHYQVVSPVNGVFYNGYMVGADPFLRGARTTTIPVLLVPFIVQFTNTATGFMTTFDPSTAPDTGCTAGQTAMSLVENSPIFQNYPWTLNGVNVGTTQYIDAFQRSNFWKNLQSADADYHTLLTYSVAEPLTLPLSYSSPTPAAEVRVGVVSSCTNAVGSGSTNGAGYQGIADYNVLEAAMTGYIASHHIAPNQFPVFILYNVMYSQNGLLYLGGYHFSEASYPQVLTSPGQTFAMANFRTNGTGPLDVSILSHEIAEWLNDPGGFNAVPPWGNIGEVTGCKRDLEVGDPLTQTDLAPIQGPNGFAYHLQELAYFSWFFRTPSMGAGGLFSDNGTLTVGAGPVCQ